MKLNIVYTQISNRGLKILIVIFIIIIFLFWQNNDIVVTEFEYKNSKIPLEFENFSILQVSDLHNKRFGKNQNKIIKEIEKSKADIIVITGDLVDRRKYNLEKAIEFIREAVKYAPVYYVSGNHEAWSGKYEEVKQALLKEGVIVLENESQTRIKNGNSIQICGVKDPAFLTSGYIDGTDTSELESNLKSWSDDAVFKILLSHRPELFDIYKANNIDLVFSGHAHGGQFRIPFLGGLIAPNQGFFPKYSSGLYEDENTTMFVSRGLGNSIIPIRLGNRPQLIKVILKSDNSAQKIGD